MTRLHRAMLRYVALQVLCFFPCKWALNPLHVVVKMHTKHGVEIFCF